MDLRAGIVRVLAADGKTAGAGFVVTPDGLIATCAHVAQAAGSGPGKTARLRWLANGQEGYAEAVAAWWRAPDAGDIAILQLVGSLPPGAQSLALGASAGAVGHRVEAFGFPNNLGTLEGLRGWGDVLGHVSDAGRPLLQLRSGEITTGFSGGPLRDEATRRVIGMVTTIANVDRYGRLGETAFATPAEALQSACPLLSLAAPPPARASSAERGRLERTLAMAQRSLEILEQQAAGYTSLTIPAHLRIELEEKRKEVADLEQRLAALEG